MAERVHLKVKRVRLNYVPHFEGAIEGHSINLIKKFFPRLQVLHEFEDLKQEAYIAFLKCKRKYSATPGMHDAWFMSLFSKALFHKLLRLQQLAARYNSIEAPDYTVAGEAENAGYFAVLWRQLPNDIKELLYTMCLAGTNEQSFRRRNKKTIRRIFAQGLADASLVLRSPK